MHHHTASRLQHQVPSNPNSENVMKCYFNKLSGQNYKLWAMVINNGHGSDGSNATVSGCKVEQ